MSKSHTLRILLPAALLAALATGCVSHVTVTSDVPGAMIRYRGHGRPSYRWQTPAGGLVRKPGDTCQFQTRYSSVDVYAIWNEGTPNMVKSEVRTVPLSNWRDPETVKLNPRKR